MLHQFSIIKVIFCVGNSAVFIYLQISSHLPNFSTIFLEMCRIKMYFVYTCRDILKNTRRLHYIYNYNEVQCTSTSYDLSNYYNKSGG